MLPTVTITSHKAMDLELIFIFIYAGGVYTLFAPPSPPVFSSTLLITTMTNSRCPYPPHL